MNAFDPSNVDFAVLADAGWPALERVDVGGWQARFACGVTKRANSAWWAGAPEGRRVDLPDAVDAVGAVGALDAVGEVDEVDAVERMYRERGLPPLFQLSAAEEPARARLIERGYRVVDESRVLAASLAPFAGVAGDAGVAPDAGVELADEPSDEWLGVWWSVDGRGGADEREVARRILTGVPALYAGLRSSGALVSVARLALVGSWGGLFCVATSPEHRRRGHSRRVVGALLAAGARCGATDAWLQVLARNAGAIALYEGLGFAEVDRYSYLLGS